MGLNKEERLAKKKAKEFKRREHRRKTEEMCRQLTGHDAEEPYWSEYDIQNVRNAKKY